MRILIRASRLSDGHKLLNNVDPTIADGAVYLDKASGSYDRVIEAPCVIPGLIDSRVHLTFDYRPGFFRRSASNIIKISTIHRVLGVRNTGNAVSNITLF